MAFIHFKTKLSAIGPWTIVHLPKSASTKLPSKGLVMVEGNFNGVRFEAALEPDGKGSHWFKVGKALQKTAGVKAGGIAQLSIEPAKACPEPAVPADLKKALLAAPQAYATWVDITPLARWDWIRWIGSTKNEETRKRRIEITFSKFKGGKRRPCCFNRTQCTDPLVSNNGILFEHS